MASTDVLNREQNRFTFSPLSDPLKGDEDSRGMSIEKKIEFLESLTGKVTNRKSRRWLNDRLLMELVPRLNAEEIRGLFAPPPWGINASKESFHIIQAVMRDSKYKMELSVRSLQQGQFVTPLLKDHQNLPIIHFIDVEAITKITGKVVIRLSTSTNFSSLLAMFSNRGDDVRPTTFSMTNAGEWDKFRSIDMDKEAKIIGVLENSSARRKGHIDADKMAFLTAWRRIECRTREALRRSFLPGLVEGFEECIRSFISDSSNQDVLTLRVQDPFHRLLLHGVCEFYNLDSATVPESKGTGSTKMTQITRKKKAMVEIPNITLTHFLKMSKEGTW